LNWVVWENPPHYITTFIMSQLTLAQVTATFYRLAKLANSEKGLSAYAIKQLYLACVISVVDYDSAIWWKGQQYLKKSLQQLQNLRLQKILKVFKTASIVSMKVKTALASAFLKLDNNTQKYTVWIKRLVNNHSVNIAI